MAIYLEPKIRKEQILNAAIRCAEKSGSYSNVTRDVIATEAGCSPSLVSNYFGTMPQIRRAIMRAAVKRSILSIVAQGIAAKDPQALKAPQSIKDAAVAWLTA